MAPKSPTSNLTRLIQNCVEGSIPISDGLVTCKRLTRPITKSCVLQAISNGPTGRGMDGPTNKAAYRVACTRLKMSTKNAHEIRPGSSPRHHSLHFKLGFCVSVYRSNAFGHEQWRHFDMLICKKIAWGMDRLANIQSDRVQDKVTKRLVLRN